MYSIPKARFVFIYFSDFFVFVYYFFFFFRRLNELVFVFLSDEERMK